SSVSPFIVPLSVSILLMPSISQPSLSCLLCSLMDFYPAQIQLRWFQGQQELLGHVVASDVVPNRDWTHWLLVEHISLEHPLSPTP
ncbi:HB2L protein, partial [Donacobius atricapilla]|nr:HB2L protein [Donacobius atricapilla]